MPKIDRMISRYTTHRIARWVAAMLHLSVAGVLFYSAVQHVENPFRFLLAVLRYEILPGTFLPAIVSAGLPCFQFAISVGMLSFVRPRAMTLSVLVLIAGLTAVQLSAVWRGLAISCGCFGSADESLGVWTIGRNLFLLVGLGHNLFVFRKNWEGFDETT